MPQQPSVIFLAGPPGVGKSTLGRRVGAELGLRFLDLGEHARQAGITPREALDRVLAEPAAELVELPWEVQLDGDALKACRRAGRLAALWAHPLEMQVRSGRDEPLFTPGRPLTTLGGFGRTGTSCLEYRRLDRACEVVLDLVDVGIDEAAKELSKLIVALRRTPSGSPAAQEGLLEWGRMWRSEQGAAADAVAVLLDAMARFLQELDRQGASPRTIGGVCDDLQAVGYLTFCYQSPKAAEVLEWLTADAYEYAQVVRRAEHRRPLRADSQTLPTLSRGAGAHKARGCRVSRRRHNHAALLANPEARSNP